LLALLPNLAIRKVTSLEPRTPHQPEKPKKLSKNEYVFTPSVFRVNEKYESVSTCLFNRVHAVHNLVTKIGAVAERTFPRTRDGCGFPQNLLVNPVRGLQEDLGTPL
jgi:hypothetical protein